MLVGVVRRRHIYFHITYPYSSCISYFLQQQHPYFFCSFFYVFRSFIIIGCMHVIFIRCSESRIITPHEYYMILPGLGICAASVTIIALAQHSGVLQT